MSAPETNSQLNFIEEIIEEDLKTGKYQGRVHTRFPPEPNGYLHIGHAKSICLNFGLALKYKGLSNLRYDDTNPEKEEVEYVNSIKDDIRWLGFSWEDREYYASDYYDILYQKAVELIKNDKAYVDHSTSEEMAVQKGTPTSPGTESPYRNRPIEESLILFEQMVTGKIEEGTCTLRAKIDMTSPNMHLRDPVIYRIKKTPHHRTGTKWAAYPMYDFAHGISDSLEGITHSICTLEFEVHRPLYDWFLITLGMYRPQQIEFARLNLTYTIMSKRNLRMLVEEGYVNGWDDPRMPTISALRRRGYTPEAIREFAKRVGVARRENMIDVGLLEFCVREHANLISKRVMVVTHPLKVIIINYPEFQTELLETENNPEDPNAGTRLIPLSREIYIEQDDFMENPPKKYFRLFPGGEVRLKSAYIIRCEEAIKDDDGNITELHCTYFPDSKSGEDTSGKKVKGTLHWVAANQALPVELRIYDRLFNISEPGSFEGDIRTCINPDSLQVIYPAYAEKSLKEAELSDRFQFIRKGYFCLDTDSNEQKLIFNQTVGLKDSWAKQQEKES
ncbi:MAG: glutamine--tRNA ligase/YqeY domain fusion protein [Sphingobacteriales bacterium]|nr:MAG: glutamine--tRNA ligase/YqeY domain fusion protein [Sphingobacteriales bacterium]